MKEFKYVITDPEGIHARPAGLLVKTGEEITMTAEGEDEDQAIAELEAFFKENL